MGLFNRALNKLPFELHIPGYRFCGPGTKLKKRLARGDVGINKLDEACKQHDIEYSQNRENITKRHEADRVLAEEAWKRVLAQDSSITEKASAWAIANTMKAKVNLGMGLKKRRTTKGKALCFNRIVKNAKTAIKKLKPKTISQAIDVALKVVKKRKIKKGIPRVIPVVRGGVLPLIPIFAGLSALGALTGGASAVARAVKDAQAAKEQLAEAQKHNRTMEAIAISRGKGLFLKPYKKGLGLYLKKNQKN